MATVVTSLKFNINTKYKPSGLAQAREDLQSFRKELKAMSRDKIKIQVEVDTAQARREMRDVTRNRRATVQAHADTAEAVTEIQTAARDRRAEIQLDADTAEFLSEMHAAVQSIQDVHAEVDVDTAAARGKLAELSARRVIQAQLKLDVGAAFAKLAALKVAARRIGTALSLSRFRKLRIVIEGGRMAARALFLAIVGLTGAFFALGQAAVTLGAALTAAFSGGIVAAGIAAIVIGDKLVKSHQRAEAAARRQAATAQASLTKAYRNVQRTAQRGAQQIASAERSVADARQNVVRVAEQGAQRIASAERSAAAASRSTERARESLTQAYKDARREIANYRTELRGGLIDEDAAEIAVERAKERLRELGSSGEPVDWLDVAEAQNDIEQAQFRLEEVRRRNAETKQKIAKADREGVEGSEKVQNAKRNLSDAIRSEEQAEQQLAQTRREAARANRDAQRAVADAQRQLAQTQQQVADANVAAQERVAAAQRQVANAQARLTEQLEQQNGVMAEFARFARSVAEPMRGPMSEAADMLREKFGALRPEFKQLFAEAAPLIDPFARALTGLTQNVLPGFTNALSQSGPIVEGFRGSMEIFGIRLGKTLEGLTQGAEGLGQTWRVVGDRIGETLQIIGERTGQFADEGAKSLDKMLGGINEMLDGMLAGIGPALEQMAGGESVWFSVFKGIGDFFKEIGPHLGEFTKQLSNALGPAIDELAPALGRLVGGGLRGMADLVALLAPGLGMIADGLAKIMDWLGPIAPALGIATAAFWALNIAMAANPITLIVVSIIGLIGLITHLVVRFELVQKTWKFMKKVFTAVVDAIVAKFTFFRDFFVELWNKIRSFAVDVWDWITKKWRDFVDGIKAVWIAASTILTRSWTKIWDGIKNWAKRIWNWLAARWKAFLSGIKAVWNVASKWLSKKWKSFWNKIKSFAKGVWIAIQAGFDQFTEGIKNSLDWIVDKAGEIWEKIKGVFARPINFVIDIWNDHIGGKLGLPDDIPRIEGYRTGGLFRGRGGPRDDENLVRISDREYIVNADATEKHMGLLNAINYGKQIPGYADGGPVEWMSGYVKEQNPGMSITSTYRNTPDYHGQGKAIDFAAGVEDMLGMARQIAQEWGPKSLELIHGNGFSANVKNGRNVGDGMGVYGPNTMANHNDHVHWAAAKALKKSDDDKGFFERIGDAIGNVVDGARELLSGLFTRLTNPLVDAIPDPALGISAPLGSIPHGMAEKLQTGLADIIRGKELEAGMSGEIGGMIPEGDRRRIIEDALRATSTPPPGTKDKWLRGMNTLISRESGWNSGAINLTDSNAAKGIPSKGLAQVIDPTFQANKAPGHGDIWAPVDNVAASINYIKSRYGSIGNVQQADANAAPRGYADGTDHARRGWAMVGERGPEMVHFGGGEEVFNFDQIGQRVAKAAKKSNFGNRMAEAGGDFLKANADQFIQDLTGGSVGNGFIGQLIKQSVEYGQKLDNSKEVHFHVTDIDEAMRKYKQQEREEAMGFGYDD